MDIEYLLWLQGLRESLPAFFEQFFAIVSAVAISKALIFGVCLIYWCLDKRAGQYVLLSFCFGALVNQFIKNMACAYRPWIRSTQIQPSQAALPDATGYSFPSGHTQTSANVFGAIGWYYRKRWPVLNVLCWVFVILVAFSRNFLGVHTPQDVIVGLIEGFVVVLLVERLIAWIDGAPGRDARVLATTLVAIVAFIAIATLKPYPMDYDAAGKLLVDPADMVVDCFKVAGMAVGAILGWFLERRFVRFEVNPKEAGFKRMAVRFAIGALVVVLFSLAPKLLQMLGIGQNWYEFLKSFLSIFAAAFVAPLVFTAIERK